MVDNLTPDELKDARRRERHKYPAVVLDGAGLEFDPNSIELPSGTQVEVMLGKAAKAEPVSSSGWERPVTGMPAVRRMLEEAAQAEQEMLKEERASGAETVYLGEPIPVRDAVQQAVDALAGQGRPTVQPEPDVMREVLGRQCKDLSPEGLSELAVALGCLVADDYENALDIVSELTEADIDPALAAMYTLIQMLMAVGTNYQLIKLVERDQRRAQ